jgi:hypothetical protein
LAREEWASSIMKNADLDILAVEDAGKRLSGIE